MYEFPDDIKQLTIWVVRISMIVTVLLTIAGLKYQLCFLIGAILSIINLIKNNFFISRAIYKKPHKAQRVMILSYLLTYVIFLSAITTVFFITGKSLWCTLSVLIGLLMVKIIVIILFGIKRKEGDTN